MRKAGLLTTFAAAAALLVGCGGGGGGTTSANVTRYVTGFVYLKGDGATGAGPAAVVTTSSVPPTGYFAPTSGTVTVTAPNNGGVEPLASNLNINMASGNAIIVKVTGPDSSDVTISGANLARAASPAITTKNLGSFSVDLGTRAANNETTLAVQSTGTFTYTPTAPAALLVTLDGAAPANNQEFVVGKPSGYALAAAVLDANGVAISGLTPTFTSSSTADVDIVGSAAVPQAATGTEGNSVTITTELTTGSLLTQSFTGTFTFGTATNVTVSPSKTTLLWDVTGTVPPVDTLTLDITVTNQFNAAMPNANYVVTGESVTANAWNTANAGTAFTLDAGTTNASGQASVTMSAPAKQDVATGTDLNAKGVQTVTVTVGSASDTTDITVTRPLGSITVAGPSLLRTNTSSVATGLNSFRVTAAADVDGTAVANPVVTWNIANANAAVTVGNDGDSALSTDATTGSSFAGNILTLGNAAGRLDVTATSGTVTSNTLTIPVWGLANRVVLGPDTTTIGTFTGPASLGWYDGLANTNLAGINVTVIDSGGNDLVALGVATVTNRSIVNTSGSTFIGGSGTTGDPFVIQAGSADGAFTVGIAGSTLGGTPFNLQKTVGVNLP